MEIDLVGLVLWLLIGAAAGWLAAVVVKGRGLGMVGNIIIGIVGAVIGGFLLGVFGINLGGLVGTLVTAFIGAVVLLAVVMLARR